MPIGQNQEARTRYLEAVELRDRNPQMPFTSMATLLGYQRASNARHAWIQGLRILGRDSEIPATRQVRVSTGGTVRTYEVLDVEGFVPNPNFSFGVEIELVNMTQRTCASTLVNAGHEAFEERYNHETQRYWKIVSDASLRGRNGTAEAVSPVLRGQQGANELRSVMKALRDGGARTNSSCGQHIHIGVDHLNRLQQANLISLHHVWNSAFDAYVLESRLNTTFSRKRSSTLRTQDFAQAWATNSNEQNMELSRRAQMDRYQNLNIASYHKYGTFEFRMHHGSLNGKNTTAWIALHTAFIQAVADGNLAYSTSEIADWLEDVNDPTAGIMDTDQIQRRIDAGYNLPRAHQVALAKMLNTKLMRLGYITQDLHDYLNARAGNVPTNATSRNA